MSSGRRIVLELASRVKQLSGVKPWRQLPSSGSYIGCNDLSTAAVKPWIGTPRWPGTKLRFFENRFIRHGLDEKGYTVDVAGLLFTRERDFLVDNKGQEIKVDQLRGKTIVLFIVPLDAAHKKKNLGVAVDTWDMIGAYHELRRIQESVVEFVLVPVRLRHRPALDEGSNLLLSTIPFPAIPFSDAQSREGPVVQTFSLDDPGLDYVQHLPYWVVIDPSNTVTATRSLHPRLFKLFGGAELHPLSTQRIWNLEASLRRESRAQLISKWDQLLASDGRDFLLSSNGDKVPISSLKGKTVGLYLCENIPHPPRMQAIKKVYEEARSRGHRDFEIVQITLHYHPLNAKHLGTDPSVRQLCKGFTWLTLPFRDPSCRKLQRILHCGEEEKEDPRWFGDSLVLIHPPQAEADSSGALFELSGAEILERWGIQGYPFTRPSLYKAEYEVQKREVTLQSFFPFGKALLRPLGFGFEVVDAISQLLGKRVLLLFAKHSVGRCADFVSMLKSVYHAQPEDSKFEVVFVSTEGCVSSTQEVTRDMPWLVQPFSSEIDWALLTGVFKGKVYHSCAAAFDEKGELIAKARRLPQKKEGDELQFPFIDQDLNDFIVREVEDVLSLY